MNAISFTPAITPGFSGQSSTRSSSRPSASAASRSNFEPISMTACCCGLPVLIAAAKAILIGGIGLLGIGLLFKGTRAITQHPQFKQHAQGPIFLPPRA